MATRKKRHSSIPHKIHQIWVGPNSIPEKYIEYMRKIKELHPDYEYRLWTNEDITPDNFSTYEYINKTNVYAQKADIMRYEILYKHGGIYLDMDMKLLKNLDPLLTKSLIVCNEDDNINTYMTNAFIASSQYNENLKRLVEGVKDVNFALSVNEGTGPYYLRKHINIDDDVNILPTNTIYPLHVDNKISNITDNSYAIHEWDKNW